MKEPEIRLTGFGVNLFVTPTMKAVGVHCQEVVNQNGKAARSGKDILLEMSPEDAMRLLAQLQSAQQQLGWKLPETPVTALNVPPAKRRN
ncbi:hypothetical protein [Microvirga sp. M2]|uniref:hypothetical protein n=1 Tax=Microvirga sp. M2 TaxID=3073270 RepID=UPI0039C3F354